MRNEVTGPFAPYEVDPFSPGNFAPNRRARRAEKAAARSRSRALDCAARALAEGRTADARAAARRAERVGAAPPRLVASPVQPGGAVCVVTRRDPATGLLDKVRVILGQPRRVRGTPPTPAFLPELEQLPARP